MRGGYEKVTPAHLQAYLDEDARRSNANLRVDPMFGWLPDWAAGWLLYG
jgi:hypothetical protein